MIFNGFGVLAVVRVPDDSKAFFQNSKSLANSLLKGKVEF